MFQQFFSNFCIILTPYSTIHDPHPVFRPLLESSIEFAYFFHLCMNFHHFNLVLVSNVSAKFQQSFSKFSTMFQQCSNQKMQTPSLFRLSLCMKSIIFYLFFIFQQCFSNVSEMFKQFFSNFPAMFQQIFQN